MIVAFWLVYSKDSQKCFDTEPTKIPKFNRRICEDGPKNSDDFLKCCEVVEV